MTYPRLDHLWRCPSYPAGQVGRRYRGFLFSSNTCATRNLDRTYARLPVSTLYLSIVLGVRRSCQWHPTGPQSSVGFNERGRLTNRFGSRSMACSPALPANCTWRSQHGRMDAVPCSPTCHVRAGGSSLWDVARSRPSLLPVSTFAITPPGHRITDTLTSPWKASYLAAQRRVRVQRIASVRYLHCGLSWPTKVSARFTPDFGSFFTHG